MTARLIVVLGLVAACGGKDPPAAPPPTMAKPQPVTIKLRNHRVTPIWAALTVSPCSATTIVIGPVARSTCGQASTA